VRIDQRQRNQAHKPAPARSTLADRTRANSHTRPARTRRARRTRQDRPAARSTRRPHSRTRAAPTPAAPDSARRQRCATVPRDWRANRALDRTVRDGRAETMSSPWSPRRTMHPTETPDATKLHRRRAAASRRSAAATATKASATRCAVVALRDRRPRP
jgi:hypothetical protein